MSALLTWFGLPGGGRPNGFPFPGDNETAHHNLERLLRVSYPPVRASESLRRRVAELALQRTVVRPVPLMTRRAWLTAAAFAGAMAVYLSRTGRQEGFLRRAIATLSDPETVFYRMRDSRSTELFEVWETRDGRFWIDRREFQQVCDGRNVWRYYPGTGVVEHWVASGAPTFVLSEIEHLLTSVWRGNAVETREGWVQRNGRDLFRLTAVVTDARDAAQQVRYEWLFTSAHRLVRESNWIKAGDGQWLWRWTREDFRYDVPVTDEMFTLEAPPGATVVER